MIEAVNSVLANAQLLRGNAEQVDASRPAPDAPQSTTSVPQAPFVSPFIAVDLNHNKAVLQIRDSETGDVVRQFPSESRLAEQSRRAQVDQQVTQTDSGDTETVGDTSSGGGASVAQAQAAAQALSNGAQAGVENLSAGVSVVA